MTRTIFAAIAVTVLSIGAAHATDSLRLLATISHAQADDANSSLEDKNLRSQAEKRLEQQRKDLARNWAG